MEGGRMKFVDHWEWIHLQVEMSLFAVGKDLPRRWERFAAVS